MEQMTDLEAWEFLARADIAHIAVIAAGEPYVSPMSFILDEGRIVFRTMAGKRLSALQESPRVSVEMSEFDGGTGEWSSVIVAGEAHETTDDELIQRSLAKLFDKYRASVGNPLGRGGLQPLASLPHVVVVEIDEITGMKSTGGLEMRTRPGRL
jgi:nitroimidazol reductase NimA-like FMN-containing flavoprotein (pyridoxamine 5'-phosphate oxidase superfamily)